MKFERIPNKKKRVEITLGVISLVAVIGITAFTLTRASYKQTQSVPLIKGSISYNKSDLEIVAIKLQQDDGTYADATEVPTSGYKLNEDVSKSYCKVGDKINKVDYKYDSGKWYINTTNKGSKCYLTFDISLAGMILAANGGASAIKAKGNPDFSKTATTDEGMYAMEDDDGISYYFRGSPTNNYVKFGKHASNYSDSTKAGKDMYWRIIRINGDGTIRLIYDGSEYHANGTSTNNSIAISNQAFNTTYNVSYSYIDYSSKAIISSNAKTKLETWYVTSGLSNYSNNIADSGFCNDRTGADFSTDDKENYKYGPLYRLYEINLPTLKCATITYENNLYTNGSKSDVYTMNPEKGNGHLTYPIGMITADEIAVSGGSNNKYYLYNGQDYWTMSPMNEEGDSFMLINSIYSGGWYSTDNYGIRPVINIDPTKINNVTIDSQGVYVIS